MSSVIEIINLIFLVNVLKLKLLLGHLFARHKSRMAFRYNKSIVIVHYSELAQNSYLLVNHAHTEKICTSTL